jgi:WD repeat-containing protein 35
MLVKQSLEQLDFVIAEKALLKLEDYMSLKIIKRIQMIGDKNIQKAEILSYYKKYDEAEELLMRIERVDLAIQLRMRLGEWQQVVNMILEVGGFD